MVTLVAWTICYTAAAKQTNYCQCVKFRSNFFRCENNYFLNFESYYVSRISVSCCTGRYTAKKKKTQTKKLSCNNFPFYPVMLHVFFSENHVYKISSGFRFGWIIPSFFFFFCTLKYLSMMLHCFMIMYSDRIHFSERGITEIMLGIPCPQLWIKRTGRFYFFCCCVSVLCHVQCWKEGTRAEKIQIFLKLILHIEMEKRSLHSTEFNFIFRKVLTSYGIFFVKCPSLYNHPIGLYALNTPL